MTFEFNWLSSIFVCSNWQPYLLLDSCYLKTLKSYQGKVLLQLSFYYMQLKSTPNWYTFKDKLTNLIELLTTVFTKKKSLLRLQNEGSLLGPMRKEEAKQSGAQGFREAKAGAGF